MPLLRLLTFVGLFLGVNNFLFAQQDSIKQRKTSFLPLPLVTRSIETDWSLGAVGVFTFPISKKDSTARTSNIEVVALYSLRKQFVAGINGNLYFKNEKYILNFLSSYSSFPDKFWGLGSQTVGEAENYSFKQYYIFAHLLRNLGNNYFIGGAVEHQNLLEVNYQTGGAFDKDNVTGRNGYQSSALALSLTKDNRNHAFVPNRGSFVQFFLYQYLPAIGSTYQFSTLTVDARKYLSLAKRQVLAVQALSTNNIGNEIPLRNLASLGGSGNMRGYYAGRYRDKSNLLLQAEYRLQVFSRFGLALFGGTGNVGNSFSNLFATSFKYAYGGGIRFALNKSEKLNLRIDYGFGNNKGSRGLYFQIGEAF